MRKASIFIHDRFAGTLEERDKGYSFSYSSDYLDQESAEAISLSLPLRNKVSVLSYYPCRRAFIRNKDHGKKSTY